MGKLTAVLAGTAILLVYSYYVLSSSFSPLINWFGPFLGCRLNLILGVMWLEQGTPLQYASIFGIWVIVGIIIGLSSKRYWGVFVTAISIWIVIGVVVALAGLAIAVPYLTSFVKGASLPDLTTLTNVPPGSNIYAILSEPVISRYFHYLVSLFTGGSLATLVAALSKQNYGYSAEMIGSIVLFFILGPLEALIIMVATGSVVLYSKKRYLGPKKEQKKKGKDKVKKTLVLALIAALIASSAFVVIDHQANSNATAQILSSTASITELSALSKVVSAAFSSGMGNAVGSALALAGNSARGESGLQLPSQNVVNVPPADPNGLLNGSLAGDAALSLVEKQGNLFNFYGAFNYSNATTGFLSTEAFSSADFSILILQSNIYQLIQSFENTSFSSRVSPFPTNFSASSYTGLLNLVPGYMYLTVYSGSLSATKGLASTAASYVASNLGISYWGQVIALNTASLSNLSSLSNVTKRVSTGPGYSIYIYAGIPTFQTSAKDFSSNLLPQIETGPVETLLQRTIDSGYLVPGANALSSNSSVIIAGDINTGMFSHLLNNTTAKQYGSLLKSGAFAIDISYWQHKFYSTGAHSINAGSLFDYHDPLNITNNGITVLGFGSDLSSSTLNASALLSGLNLTLFTNNATAASAVTKYGDNSSKIMITLIPNGPFYLSNYGRDVNATFPANLSVSVNVKHQGGNSVLLSFTIKNNGNQTVSNLNVSLQRFFSTYKTTMAVENNAPETVYIKSISPGGNAPFVYGLKLNGTGEYYLPPIVASYSYAGTSFSSQYGSGYWISAPKPSVAYAVTSSVLTIMSVYAPLKTLSEFHLGPLNLVELIILLIIVIDLVIEYRAFSHWRKERTSVPQVPEHPPQGK
jgi:hypothetical protein